MSVWYQRLCSPAARRHGERLPVDQPLDTLTTVGIGGAGAGGGDWYWLRDTRGMTIWVECSNGFHPEPGGRRRTRRFEGCGHDFVDCTDAPLPALTTDGWRRIVIEYDGRNGRPSMVDKPPYAIPSMAEIAARPWNGYSVVSTFAGAGGSSTGYRMAGFRILWVNEFVEAARETYRANARPETIIDGRDVRQLQGKDILAATGLGVGDLDVLDGSPPCASFSTAGDRHKGWGDVKKYSDTAQRTDDLFFEYARLVDELQPKCFVAENVSGLVKGTAKGYFLEILRALRKCGYLVAAQLLDAQWLGVPQSRQRLIFVGVRGDLGIAPKFPTPLAYRYSIRDALPWLVSVKGGNKAPFTSKGRRYSLDAPSATIMGGDKLGLAPFQFEIEAKSDISGYAIADEWDKIGHGGQSEKYFQLVRPAFGKPCPTITATGGITGAAGVTHPVEKRKFAIAELRRLCGFPDDFVLTGSYAQQWERLGRAVPPPMMAAIAATLRDDVLAKISERERTHGHTARVDIRA